MLITPSRMTLGIKVGWVSKTWTQPNFNWMDPILDLRKSQYGWNFKRRVTNFKPLFLSPLRSKLKNFSAHQKENFLRFLKLILLLFLVSFLRELWAFKTWGRFFWDTLYLLWVPFHILSTFADSIQIARIAANQVHVCSLTLWSVQAGRVWLYWYGGGIWWRTGRALAIVLMKAHVTFTESIFTMGIERTPVVALVVVVVLVVVGVVVHPSSEHSVHQVAVINPHHCRCSPCS